MELLKPSAVLAALLLAGGCELQREPTPLELTGEEVMVHSVLEAGSDTVSVLLTRVRPGFQGRGPNVSPLSGAEVRISGGGSTARLTEAPAGFGPCLAGHDPQTGRLLTEIGAGCYAAILPGGVRTGTRYELTVTGTGGEIRGSTTVPEPPTILTPEDRARIVAQPTGYENPVAGGSLSLRWSATEGASVRAISMTSRAVFRNGAPVANTRCDFPIFAGEQSNSISAPDNSVKLGFQIVNCFERPNSTTLRPVRPDSVQARLLIAASDTASSRYSRYVVEQSARRKNLAAGVTGALGVFGGTATAERQVTLVIVR